MHQLIALIVALFLVLLAKREWKRDQRKTGVILFLGMYLVGLLMQLDSLPR